MKTSIYLLATGLLLILTGFVLMAGSGSSATAFNPELFSLRRIALAPATCLAGYLLVGWAILKKK